MLAFFFFCGLNTMWVRPRDRAGITDPIWFKNLRALGATDAARAGRQMHDIQKRLVHTTLKTSEIYIKEAIRDISAIDINLPWKSN